MITAQTSATGWAFLVARGRHIDYRTVLAPDFLVDARAPGILSYSVTQADARPGETRTIAVAGPQGERLHVHYRNESPATQDAWLGGPDALLDEHGRPFEIVYGVVTRPPAGPTDRDLAQARGQALESYRAFLEHEDDHHVARSEGFALDPHLDAEPITPSAAGEQKPPPNSGRVWVDATSEPDEQEPETRFRPFRLVAAGAAAVAALAAIGIAIAALSGSNTTLDVRARSIGCSQPLVASIATSGAQTVDYQWNSATGALLRQGRLRFAGAGSQQVSLTTVAQGAVRLNVSAGGQTRVVTFRC